MKTATCTINGKRVSIDAILKILDDFVNSIDEDETEDTCADCTECCCDTDRAIPKEALPESHTAHLRAFRQLYNEVLEHGYKVTVDDKQNMRIYQTTDILVDI